MSTDVAETPTEETTSALVRANQRYPELRLMLTRALSDAQYSDSHDAQLSILENMLLAEDEDELFERQEGGVIGSKEFVNIPFRLTAEGVQWKKSADGYTKTGGMPVYALLRVTTVEDRQDRIVSCGAPSVLGVLDKLIQWELDEDRPAEKKPFARWDEFGGRPFMFVEKPMASGFAVILFKPLEKNPPAPTVPAKKARASASSQ